MIRNVTLPLYSKGQEKKKSKEGRKGKEERRKKGKKEGETQLSLFSRLSSKIFYASAETR